MSDSFTEVTRRSWFSRVGGSFGGMLFGLLLLVAGIVLLFWNEGRAVTTARSLDEGASIVVSVASNAVDPANEGRLVHLTGTVATDETLTDPSFGISASGVRLVRNVEMYQWKETTSSTSETKLGGGEETVTTYSYGREWSGRPIDSSGFRQPDGHANPDMTIESRSFQIGSASLGAFRLDEAVLGSIGGGEDVPVGADLLPAVRDAIGGTQPVSVVDGRIHIGRDPARPRVGDYRISFELVPLGPISVIARQAGDGLDAYPTRAGDELLLVEAGTQPAAEMFQGAQAANTMLTWILRLVGLVILYIAYRLLFAPVGVLADVIPLLGRIARAGTGLIAFALTVATGTVVIAIAWFWYRPLLSLAIIVIGGAITWFFARRARRAAAANTAPSAA